MPSLEDVRCVAALGSSGSRSMANYFACAVLDCLWRLHCVGEAFHLAWVDQVQ